jgi:hypothetical protein
VRKAEEETAVVEENAEWEKDQSRIREYLQSFGAERRTEGEIVALTASSIGRGQISSRLRQSIIDKYVLNILNGHYVLQQAADERQQILSFQIIWRLFPTLAR